jgi:hypothetical protein
MVRVLRDQIEGGGGRQARYTTINHNQWKATKEEKD